MCRTSQSLVFPSTSQHQFTLSKQLYLVVPALFLCHAALLNETKESVLKKRLHWSCRLQSRSLTSGNALSPSDINAAWERYPRINITWDMLEIHNASKEQSSSKQLYRLDIEHVRLVDNCHARSVFIANKQGPFQVPTFVCFDSFGVACSFKAHFVNALAPWLFPFETIGANFVFMDVIVSWGSRVLRYNNDILVCNRR